VFAGSRSSGRKRGVRETLARHGRSIRPVRSRSAKTVTQHCSPGIRCGSVDALTSDARDAGSRDDATATHALDRNLSYGLIDGQAADALQETTWSKLRLTARGLIVRGEWPDLDRGSRRKARNREPLSHEA
jgi:hypothetical protein